MSGPEVWEQLEAQRKAISMLQRRVEELSHARERLTDERRRPLTLNEKEDWRRVQLLVSAATHNTYGAGPAHAALSEVVAEYASTLFRLAEMRLQAQERAVRIELQMLNGMHEAVLNVAGEFLERPLFDDPEKPATEGDGR